MYPNYAEAYKAWKAAAQRTVDNAQMRYFIVHIHRLLDPELPRRRRARDALARPAPTVRACRVGGIAAADLIGRRRANRRRPIRESLGQTLQIAAHELRPLALDERARGTLRRFVADWIWPRWREIAVALRLHGGPGGHHRRLPAHHQAFLRLADEGRQPRAAVGAGRHRRASRPRAACSSTCTR